MSPYLPCNPEWITDDCNEDADNAIECIYTKEMVRAESRPEIAAAKSFGQVLTI